MAGVATQVAQRSGVMDGLTLRNSMAAQQIRVLANDARSSGRTIVAGSQLWIDGTQVQNVMGLNLVADIGGLWKLQVEIPVDPATLFGRLSQEAAK